MGQIVRGFRGVWGGIARGAMGAWLVCCFGVARGADPVVEKAQAERVATVERISPAVVAIFDPGARGGGSGVLISKDGFALTNFHVVSATPGFMKCGLNDGRLYDAVTVGEDPTGDVALIKLLGREDFPVANIGNSDRLRVGDTVFAVGNPFLLATDFKPTVTYGLVSGVHRYQFPAGTFLEYTDCIQVDASINPGNSGGPLFNDRGELVGINGRISFEKRARVNSGVGYAISINQCMNFLDHLKSGRIVDHATLGATVSGTDEGAVVFSRVQENSDVARLGLQSRDELVSFAGRSVRNVNQFKNILGTLPQGWKVPVVYRRNGQESTIVVRLQPLHSKAELESIHATPQMPPEQKKHEEKEEGPGDPEKRDAPKEGPEGPKKGLPRMKGLPFHELMKGPEVPEEVKPYFQPRPGYVNFYFNELQVQRLLPHLAKLGTYPSEGSLWTMSGKTGDGGPFEFKLGGTALGLTRGEEISFQELSKEWMDQPAGTGGLLPAIQQWKDLLTQRGSAFTELYYLGGEPLDGVGAKVDVLVTTRGELVCRWYFSESGELVGFDKRISESVPECEIRFVGSLEVEGRVIPRKWSVSSLGKSVGVFEMERVSIVPSVPGGGENKTAASQEVDAE